MNRKELYKQGKFFIRKRHHNPRGRMYIIEPTWAIYISKEYCKWNLAGKFDTEEECDWEIEQYVANYDNCIIE